MLLFWFLWKNTTYKLKYNFKYDLFWYLKANYNLDEYLNITVMVGLYWKCISDYDGDWPLNFLNDRFPH